MNLKNLNITKILTEFLTSLTLACCYAVYRVLGERMRIQEPRKEDFMSKTNSCRMRVKSCEVSDSSKLEDKIQIIESAVNAILTTTPTSANPKVVVYNKAFDNLQVEGDSALVASVAFATTKSPLALFITYIKMSVVHDAVEGVNDDEESASIPSEQGD